jgi:hypothetical protein
MNAHLAAMIVCLFVSSLTLPEARAIGEEYVWGAFGMDVLSVKGLVLPVYAPRASGSNGPMAVVRIERFSTDYQRKGFFRIGLLPMLVADGVVFEIFDPTSAATALEKARFQIKALCGTGVFELRRVRFLFQSTPDRQLEAKRIRFDENGVWEIEGLEYRDQNRRWQAGKAMLVATGGRAGELRFEADSRPRILNIFQAPFPYQPRPLNLENSKQ